jgi:hypothetical protein
MEKKNVEHIEPKSISEENNLNCKRGSRHNEAKIQQIKRWEGQRFRTVLSDFFPYRSLHIYSYYKSLRIF